MWRRTPTNDWGCGALASVSHVQIICVRFGQPEDLAKFWKFEESTNWFQNHPILVGPWLRFRGWPFDCWVVAGLDVMLLALGPSPLSPCSRGDQHDLLSWSSVRFLRTQRVWHSSAFHKKGIEARKGVPKVVGSWWSMSLEKMNWSEIKWEERKRTAKEASQHAKLKSA